MSTSPSIKPEELLRNSSKQSPDWEIVGIDVSRWQREINWQQALSVADPVSGSAGISFAFIKSTEGTKVIDSQFERNMQETARLGIPRGIYHYFKPTQDWKAQADHFAAVINAQDFELEPVLDLERHAGLSRQELAKVAENFVKHVEDQIGRQLLIYTSPGFFDSHLPLTDWAWRRPLWVAHWTKAPQPRLPREWSSRSQTWLYWQHSSDKNGLGSLYGVATKNIDLNRFNGTRQEFMQRYNLSTLPEPPPVDPPDPPIVENQLAPRYQVKIPALHVRSGPGINYPILRDLHASDIVQALDVSAPKEAWLKIGDDQWCAIAYNSHQFLKKV